MRGGEGGWRSIPGGGGNEPASLSLQEEPPEQHMLRLGEGFEK